MDDPILRLRLDMLTENLDAALRMRDMLAKDLNTLAIDTRLGEVLQDAFVTFASRLRKDLQDARKELDAADQMDPGAIRDCWDRYAELDDRNAQLQREFLEAMVGLAVRREQLDDSLCEIADALILSMNRLRLPDTLAIPASREADSRTLARLVRMRFPEWSIWSLPLVAHEFGHVVIEDVPDLAPIVEKVTSELLEREPQWIKEPKDARDEKSNRATTHRTRCRARKLLADAFALYMIGPSYACSLVLMRLHPGRPESAQPRDTERAALVLEVMRRIAESDSDALHYNDVIGVLEHEWKGVMERSGVDSLTEDERKDLAKLSATIDREFADLPGIGYRSILPGNAGWNTAYAWYSLWQNHDVPNRLPQPAEVTPSSKLSDALNAAWAYRLFAKPDALEPVALATRELCRRIMKTRAAAQRRGGGRRAFSG